MQTVVDFLFCFAGWQPQKTLRLSEMLQHLQPVLRRLAKTKLNRFSEEKVYLVKI